MEWQTWGDEVEDIKADGEGNLTERREKVGAAQNEGRGDGW